MVKEISDKGKGEGKNGEGQGFCPRETKDYLCINGGWKRPIDK